MVLKLQASHEKGDKNAHMGPLSTHTSFWGKRFAMVQGTIAFVSAYQRGF